MPTGTSALSMTGSRQTCLITARTEETGSSFHNVPAVVFAARTGHRLEVHFLDEILADVGDEEVAGRPVEGEAPGIAQSVRPDLAKNARLSDEGVSRRDGVRGDAGLHIEPQEIPEQRGAVLGVLELVVGAAAVPQGNVEKAVRTEGELPGVVVGGGLRDEEQHLFTGRQGNIGVLRREEEAAHHGGPVGAAGVIDVEMGLLREAGGKGEAEQPPLTAGKNLPGDIQERGRQERSVPDNPHPARLLDNE
jgi:hypothetical protein